LLSLGFDIGSSSVKASLLDCATGQVLAQGFSPSTELPISSPQPGWAEQDPATWWSHSVILSHRLLKEAGVDAASVGAIGISYQMHGLVLVDEQHEVLRPAIIWCDSRAVETGRKAFESIGSEFCLSHLLNSPGNFTASKLAWVRENEPEVYSRAWKALLPGDYLALRMTGEASTTVSGLSEGIWWDFNRSAVSKELLEYYRLDETLLPEIRPTFAVQGQLTAAAAQELGLKAGTPVSYRAGDQPNNAFSLNVLNPGEVAATAGTSGVVYGVIGRVGSDQKSRVNPFAHVNHTATDPRLGVLLCINGTGILNSWLRRNIAAGLSYDEMNAEASSVAVGSDSLSVMPFGNGAERILENRNLGAQFMGLDFNRHGRGHILRASQEGIAFSLAYGIDLMKAMGLDIQVIRAGRGNMFLSPIFRETLANTTGATIELFDTDGAQGAARGAAVGAGLYPSFETAFASLRSLETISPNPTIQAQTNEAYRLWLSRLESLI